PRSERGNAGSNPAPGSSERGARNLERGVEALLSFRTPRSEFRVRQAGVTQPVEYLPFKQGVVGSTPTAGTSRCSSAVERPAETGEVLVRLQPPGLPGSAGVAPAFLRPGRPRSQGVQDVGHWLAAGFGNPCKQVRFLPS